VAAIISVVAVVLVSILINRVATIALSLTGMSEEHARFQARAAMSGVGLTTRSPEEIVGHPVRRRIVFWLMLVGSAGVVTGIASLVLSFRAGTSSQQLTRGGVLLGALVVIWLALRTPLANRLIAWAFLTLLHAFGLHLQDASTLVRLSDEYAVAELHVREGDWIADRTLGELKLRDEGLTVMGIESAAGGYVGTPHGEVVLHPGDTIVIYGLLSRIHELDRRRRDGAGERAHEDACAERQTRAG
jgi:hypothetical protein